MRWLVPHRCFAAARRTSLVLLALVGIVGCSRACSSEPAPVAKAPAKLTPEPPAPPPPPPPAEPRKLTPADVTAPLGYPKDGWTKTTFDEQVPMCLFSSLKEQFETKLITDVRKQTLRAGEKLAIGTFGPWCINEQCDDLPSLQCSAELQDHTLIVKSHYWAYHKDGSDCAGQICRPVYAGCETPELPAGKYTIQYGDKTFPFKVPSVLRDPCFVDELPWPK